MFLFQYAPEILLRSGEHLILVAIAMTVAIAIGLPVGILLTRKPKLAPVIMGLANGIQTIPSLAIFGFLISVPFFGGIGKTPAIVALSLYALLPIIRNTYIGINGINPAVREAGVGMGMTDRQLLMQVEIPLALGVILAGVRVASVISVGIATIAAAIGGGGLGTFIFRGISTVNNELILAGAIPATIIALGADFLLGLVEKNFSKQTKRKPNLAVIFGLITLFFAGIIAFNYKTPVPTIVIGSKNFTEQIILGEILAQHIENNTTLKVDRQFNLGGTFICHEAVKAGKIAGYVEYTGTAFTAVLKEKPITDPQVVYEKVKQVYDQSYQLTVMPPLGFENTFAMLMRGEDAKNMQIKTISDVAPYSEKMRAGFGPEFLERSDGYPGLSKTYNLKFPDVKQIDLGLMYEAIKAKQVDFIAASSTDGLIPILGLVILEDDRKYFPPYQAVPVFNQAILAQYPELTPLINQLSGKISTEEIQKMNYQVDNNPAVLPTVVKDWLKSEQL